MAFPLRDIYTTPADLSGIFTCNLGPNFKQLSVCVFLKPGFKINLQW